MSIKPTLDLLVYIFNNWKSIKTHFSKKEFLNEDISFLQEAYDKEITAGKEIPYSVISKFYTGNATETIENVQKIKLTMERVKFQLKVPNNSIQSFQAKALEAFKNKMSNDGSIVRLSKLITNDKNEILELKMQHAKYSDQVKSNLTLDWNAHGIKGFTTLRSYLNDKYGNSLPPMSCGLLANTIGISCILYFKKSNQYIPYLPKRSKYKPLIHSTKKSLAIFEGGIHVTASGALDFPQDYKQGENLSFCDFILEDMYREIYEEVGITKKYIQELVPLAFTRELLRAGKPQIFFAGILKESVNEEALIKLRKQSILRQKKNKREKIEIENKSLVIYDMDDLLKESSIHGLTIEAIGNLFFSQEYIADKNKLLAS